ncbi:MAG: N-acetyl-gamma-glutamyl-phosphate reductase [Candidatus Margulisbacteria bacterium]|nr:N-acetyl-gamma-glutamyl-phosphate reductase [Candidatus Margulisiibacteriota bacterium]MBU1022426.1 N-acetyl-gamma-glutamyl-phosphate reductase [Candidatus Margulisiibacteriota bacterium]MBU1728410.1 N-acetyl-gamma-glutamyl-phosphate reductase [Candidatus Margulisiibacteriota bacterium]MBU1954557.1 N-acetyl-gamma-glutamyl-phosphate reductase [Candidatus Margulisiibacteriota bacterium]
MAKIKAGIIGATGYSGETLLSLLLKHPSVSVEVITSRTYGGKKISEVYPHLAGICDLVCQKPNMAKLPKLDVAFVALPHGLSQAIIPDLLKKGIVVIDIGADFRFRNADDYTTWYGVKHKSSSLCETAVYGIPEIHAKDIKKASLIANPGCYATAAILGLYPLIKENLITDGSIVVDAKSGVSGAGRALSLNTHYCECSESISAYKIAVHRHTGEIEQELGTKITFVPHLTPMNRGILATIYASVSAQHGFFAAFERVYKKAPFVRLYKKGLPSTKNVAGTNYCDIAVTYDKRTEKVIIISALDNLIKGAAGQAVQNMNIRFGFPAKAGLDLIGVYP